MIGAGGFIDRLSATVALYSSLPKCGWFLFVFKTFITTGIVFRRCISVVAKFSATAKNDNSNSVRFLKKSFSIATIVTAPVRWSAKKFLH